MGLSYDGMGADWASALAPALQALTGQQLDLCCDETTAALAPILMALTGLQQLCLTDSHLGVEGAATLTPARWSWGCGT
jgi:hypothetical protein